MYSIPGYYDGVNVRPLAQVPAKPNQRVIITVTDDFVQPETAVQAKGMRGALAQYANPALREKEEGAWEHAAVEKHGHL